MPTVLDSLTHALDAALAEDRRVILLGEDLLDPYGGAFKVTKGLSTKYPDRVFTTPVSESGIVGLAAGMALRGFRPVVEIMFGDFVTLIADQLINHIAKYRYMYNDQVRVPVVIRTPMGGRRGYGPTHSQTLEKIYLGVPGLRILAANSFDDPGEVLKQAILNDDDPVLFVENKLLYSAPLQMGPDSGDFSFRRLVSNPLIQDERRGIPSPGNGYAHWTLIRLRDAPPPQLTLVTYGYMAELGCQAILRLAYDEEVFVEMVVPTQLSPFEIEPVIRSTANTGRLLVLEEGSLTMGWGAEIVTRAVEVMGTHLRCVRRVAAKDFPIPSSLPLEAEVLPGVEDILQAVKGMV